MKITIDEGFFGFFLDLVAKKKRPAGEAIDKKKVCPAKRLYFFLLFFRKI